MDGVSEGSLSSLTGFFGSLANTYATVKGALDNNKPAPAQVAKQSVGVTSNNFLNKGILIALSVGAAVLILVIVLRK